jgi:hypothetical protein
VSTLADYMPAPGSALDIQAHVADVLGDATHTRDHYEELLGEVAAAIGVEALPTELWNQLHNIDRDHAHLVNDLVKLQDALEGRPVRPSPRRR